MGTRIETTYYDDISGKELDGPVKPTTLTYGGKVYSWDLAPESVEKLEAALAPFLEKAQKSSGSVSNSVKRSREDLSTIRDWARNNGYELGDRGRIPAEIREAYNAAN